MTGRYRYRTKDLFGDYARAAAGALICLAPAVFVDSNSVTLGLAAVGLLFVVFGLRTALRQATEIVVDDQGMAAVGPLPRRIEWKAVQRVKLSYYTTRRDRQGGWMHMTLSGHGGTIRIDSALEGFDDIARRVGRTAQENGAELSDTTRANFAALNIVLPDTPATDRAT
ncbi:MAG: hypothetical protein KF889_09770 [Alphaproteobacteria bacterium]|nr:hypothetical protein [Alphaproteobacteria bacterium]MCW5741110.1 hypothetical protein [Alphaproteobacteria bacterium]